MRITLAPPLSLSVRPSIGMVLSPRDGTTADELIARADLAMYQAKRERTGCAFFQDTGAAALETPPLPTGDTP